MRTGCRLCLPSMFLASMAAFSVAASAQTATPLCTPTILANQELVTPTQRQAAGNIAQPPLTDTTDGFAWPDTPLGVIKTNTGYQFFGSDGGLHTRQVWQGRWYGNNKYGSVTRTLGTLDNPLGSEPPLDVTISPNPNPAVNPFYQQYDYMGGGPVYKIPQGMPGAGNLLMVYHAEIPTITTQSFYAVLALASSSNDGMSWMDLGEIIRVNQAYRTDLDGFDIGDSTLLPSPDGKYYYIFFPEWHANGSTHWGNTMVSIAMARAPIAAVLGAAFGPDPHAITFEKYYEGWNYSQGLGGFSTDLDPQTPYGGSLEAAYNGYVHRYQLFINAGVVLYYTESPDGMNWSPLTTFYDFRNDPTQPSVYAAFVGTGDDPNVLGKRFYVFYTSYPNNGLGWPGASVNRFTVSCP